MRLGFLAIILNVFLIIAALFLSRFGIAEKLGNILIFLSFFIIFFQIRKTNSIKPDSKVRELSKWLVVLGFAGIFVSVILAFRPIFLPGPLVWGDAPYISNESFKNFLAEPLVWESRGRLGVANDLYFLFPLTLIYNFLGFLGLGNDLVIRLVFYLPAIFLAIFSAWKFSQYFNFSPVVKIFTAFLYSLNTYFIILIDGGQVGVSLAYGLFPLALLGLHKLIEKKSPKQFLISLISFMFLTMAYVRFAAIALL